MYMWVPTNQISMLFINNLYYSPTLHVHYGMEYKLAPASKSDFVFFVSLSVVMNIEWFTHWLYMEYCQQDKTLVSITMNMLSLALKTFQG